MIIATSTVKSSSQATPVQELSGSGIPMRD